ncbi:gluconate 2-dehydrogenase subunit 3 family protein [Virgibacillus halophilus]|uniref:Gluconate 2-dehydrogenase subunit 3 family protein n=1 Tax=Tigheibacillus halophilus TaxID=361280 RepID=A0ABU5C3X0_9BACI|nr:gluconate 2-dehydrogenase subunit 3 family protein [Virgibacillus halophilus]
MAENKNQDVDMSRRKFLKNSAYVAGGVVGGGLIGSIFGVNLDGGSQQTSAPVTKAGPNYNQALMYFTKQKDFKVLSKATERIYPKDENGPGAEELGVPYFIDHQLAGSYGNNTQEYMQAPFHPGTNFQGYQTSLKRHEVFMEGIKSLEKQSQKDYQSSFIDLDTDQQDKILEAFEKDKVKMKGVQSSFFFNLLLSATLAGVYSDPLYGGNIDMQGWKMKEFPGSQMSYTDKIESKDFIKMEPKALNEHQ